MPLIVITIQDVGPDAHVEPGYPGASAVQVNVQHEPAPPPDQQWRGEEILNIASSPAQVVAHLMIDSARTAIANLNDANASSN